MVMGSDDGGEGSARSRSTKQQLSGGQSSVVAGGLVVGIATVVVVGVAGKLFSKLRKPKDLANNNTPYVTPTGSLDKVIHEENPDLQISVEGVKVPTNEILVNGKSSSALDLENEGSDHNGPTTASVVVDTLDISAHSDLHTELSPRITIGRKLSPDQPHSDDSGLFKNEHSKEGDESSTASETALTELLNHALLDAEHERTSKHELLSNTKALQDGIVGVISRAFEDFSYGGTPSDELSPTKVKLTISWETNSSSGSEEEVVQAHKEASLGENELLPPGSTETEADEQVIERVKHDEQVSQDEVAPEPVLASSAPMEEQVSTSGDDLPQEEELQGATNSEGNETDGEAPLHAAGSYVESNESTNPEEVPVVLQDKIERQSSTGVLKLKEEVQELVSLVDEVKKVLQSKEEIQEVVSLVVEVKKEKTVQECDYSQKHADHNQEAKISLEVTSNLLRSTESSPNEIEPAQGEDSVHISTQIVEEGTTVVVTKKETTPQECDGVQRHADYNEEANVSIHVTSNLLRSTESSPNEITPAKDEDFVQISTQIAEKEGTTVVVTKKETTSQECNGVQRHADHNEEAEVSVNLTSNLLRSTESSPNEITQAKDEDFVQISTQLADEDARTVAVTSLMLPASSREVTNITKIVAAKEYTVTAGTRKADVVTDVEFITSTAGGLKREVEGSWRGNWLSFEVLGLGLIVVLIAILVWSIGARDTSSVPRLY